MTNQTCPWHQSLTVLLLSAVALPPLGLVLLWMRRGTKVVWKLLGTIPILGFAVAHLFLFFGLRMEMDGAGSKPGFPTHRRQLQAGTIPGGMPRTALAPSWSCSHSALRLASCSLPAPVMA